MASSEGSTSPGGLVSGDQSNFIEKEQNWDHNTWDAFAVMYVYVLSPVMGDLTDYLPVNSYLAQRT